MALAPGGSAGILPAPVLFVRGSVRDNCRAAWKAALEFLHISKPSRR